ncbi:MAG: nicotinamide-nucleotide amidohydrolase family protein [Candidatus Omnitrophica bacterium]|nr:nicotinamide-nucleotide amidohydrolase family protein [Candidatus Omnitrophota bacterium]
MRLKEVTQLLKAKNKTIAVAESLTGGLISKLLTDIAGSSQYFILGLVAYSNVSKNKLLSIPKSLIEKYGAVSRQVAQKMAANIRKMAKTDLGIGITGIAGPSGGSKEKPVGTVYIAIDCPHCHTLKKFHFKGKRILIRKKAALQTLKLLKQCLKK